MKIAEIHDILNCGLISTVPELKMAWNEIEHSIKVTDWPHGSKTFTIRPESGKKTGMGNGVKPIKLPCMEALKQAGWKTEKLPLSDIGSSVLRTGDLDALKKTQNGYIAFEWETGNISSCHRAINKLLITMQETNTLGSFLVVPSNALKPYLTDRIGNIGELEPYFPLWKNIPSISGALRIVAVEHDSIDENVPRIPKGTDGRATI